jgi:glycosyltransferase involved in cell wall biosynthesis
VPLSVLALTRYSDLGASSRQRFHLYSDALRDAGIEVTISEFFDDSYLTARYSGAPIWRTAAWAYARRLYRLLSPGRYDLLWIEKEVLPFLPAGVERLLFGSIPYVIDIDDAWFFKYGNHRLRPIRRFLGAKFGELVRRSALTVVGNSYLGAWARANGAPVVQLLPTVVDILHYPPHPPAVEPFTIGWIGTPMTVRYLEHIAEPLRQICDGKTARLRIIGDTSFRLPGVACVNDAWEKATEAELVSQCHVGIMPLPDDPWIHGKCGYKLIQFLAAGRAVVTSPTEANRAILGGGKAGFLAATNDEWVRALMRLRDDPQLRGEMAAAGRDLVERNYSLTVTAEGLARHLFAAAGKTYPVEIVGPALAARSVGPAPIAS